MKVSIILGTRPEIIKMAPVIKELIKRDKDFYLIHTGQHYSYDMDKIFFKDLELPQPSYNLDIGSWSHGIQTGRMIEKLEQTLMRDPPDIVLVEGDTNTVLAGALAAAKLHIKVGHVEAGLRSYDKFMPEEINRILTDHISDFLFVPTDNAKDNLKREGLLDEKIHITGNTIVDSVYDNINLSIKRSNVLDRLKLKKKEYILVTIHRQENVDDKERFIRILKGLEKISKDLYQDYKMIYPIHPRSKKMIKNFKLQDNIDKINNLVLCDPVGYLEFLQLEDNAKLVTTDSGGIQEEACILNVPCITLRDNTERPETVRVGANMLTGTNPDLIFSSAKIMISKKIDWINPFGNGDSGKMIVDIIMTSGM